MQQMYRVYDENRLGLHNTKAFAKSMKRVGSYPPLLARPDPTLPLGVRTKRASS